MVKWWFGLVAGIPYERDSYFGVSRFESQTTGPPIRDSRNGFQLSLLRDREDTRTTPMEISLGLLAPLLTKLDRHAATKRSRSPSFWSKSWRTKIEFQKRRIEVEVGIPTWKGTNKSLQKVGDFTVHGSEIPRPTTCGCKKKPVGSGINYLCNISSINSISGGNIKTDIKTLKNRLRWNKHSMFTQIMAEIDQEWYHLNWFPN